MIKRIAVYTTGTKPDVWPTLRDLDREDKEHGLNCIGAHYIIHRDGDIERGRPLFMGCGYPCDSYKPTEVLGILLIGGVSFRGKADHNTFTPDQRAALKSLVKKNEELLPVTSVVSMNQEILTDTQLWKWL